MRVPLLGAVSLAFLASACSDGGTDTATIAFNVATRAEGGVPLAMSGDPDTLTDGTNVLVIDTAQLVIRDIKLHLVEDGLCSDDDDDQDDDSSGGDDDLRTANLSDDDENEDDDCDEVRVGPFLLDLPLGPGAARQFTVEVPAGSYREVDFKVHKPSDDSDAAFVAANPEFRGRSVRVVGTWNGTPFIYTGDAEGSQETEFNPPLVVGESAGTDLTLFVDLATWFRVNGALIDPALANEGGPWADQVENNVKNSIRTFCDEDRDGHDDDDEDDGDDNSGPGGESDD